MHACTMGGSNAVIRTTSYFRRFEDVGRGGSKGTRGGSEISAPCVPQKVQDKAATCQNFIN